MEKPAMSDDLTAPAASEPEAEGSAPKANETKAEETKKPEESLEQCFMVLVLLIFGFGKQKRNLFLLQKSFLVILTHKRIEL